MGNNPVNESLGEAWERVCRPAAVELEIQLVRGNWQAAHAIVDRLQLQASGSCSKQRSRPLAPLETPLHLVIGERLANALERSFGAITVGQLNEVPWEQIQAVAGVGPKGLEEILLAWRTMGFVNRSE